MAPLDRVVVGGGISGLTAAWKARRSGERVVLLEASDRLGGCLHTRDVGGAIYDAGASSTLLRHDSVRRFLDESGLGALRIDPSPEARRRYVLRAGRLVPIPTNPIAFAASPLFSPRDKLGLLAEPWRRGSNDADESVAAFTRRRLGESFLTNAVAPFVSGVFAGDPERLSLRHAFPLLAELERDHGSLIRGALARRRTGPTAVSVNFRGGMQRAAEHLAAGLGDALRRRHRVERIRRVGDGVRVEGSCDDAPFSFDASQVVVALPGYALPAVLGDLDRRAELFRELPYASVASVFSVYGVEQFATIPRGFGFLTARAAGSPPSDLRPESVSPRILGCLFVSDTWNGRAGPDEVTLTALYGGRLDPDAVLLSETELAALAHRELTSILRIEGPAIRQAVTVWRPAIPQLEVGHDRFLAAAEAIEAEHPAIRLLGNYRLGVSVADCIDRALDASRQRGAGPPTK